jgi:hypothetical protein
LRARKEDLALILAIALTVLMFGIVGCDVGRPVSDRDVLSATVHLKDTVGHETSVFRSGEDFDITVKLTNISGKRLQFTRYNSAPDVLFRILRGDSVIAYSTHGPFLMVVTIGYLNPGETMEGHWRGPSPMNRSPNVALPPGAYSLVISFPKFDQVEKEGLPSIRVSVVESGKK